MLTCGLVFYKVYEHYGYRNVIFLLLVTTLQICNLFRVLTVAFL